MDMDEVLGKFDAQVRRDGVPEAGGRVDRVGGVVRHVGGWTGALWSGLDEEGADAAIAGELGWLASAEGRGREYEWKLYAHDRPADLGERLARAGFTAEEPETLMVAEVAGLDKEPRTPEGVRLEVVTGADGVEVLTRVHEAAFGTSAASLREQLLEQVARAPETMRMVVAVAGDEPVSAARMEIYPGTEFAGLWGGGTVPRWRGRGIYRALIAHRARTAEELGVRYLQVDAAETSRPILERLGFAALSVTTPYLLQG